jgi:hypothetical protein
VSELSPERPISNGSTDLRQNFIAYVTGTLAAAERDAFEERLLADEEFSQLAVLVEQDVLEDYATDSLISTEQESLRPWIMASARRREHVQVTRLLLQNSRRKFQTRKSVWLWLAAAACIAFSAMLFVHPHVPSPILTASSKPSQISPEPIAPQANVILLVAERLRGSATQNESVYALRLQAPTRIQVILPSADNEARYTLLLRLTENDHSLQDIVRVGGLAVRNVSGERYIETTLPPGHLRPGTYIAEVRSSDGNYAVSFRVSAQSKTR